MKKTVIGIVGPTASGKTALSLPVAKALGGEIVCMDSMQIYRGLDIGTAKPTPKERVQVPHHMLDILAPEENFSVSQYARRARACLDAIPTPLLVGGTGLYLQSLSLPMDYGAVAGDETIRARYRQISQDQGPMALHDLLRQRDPVTAARLHPNDVKRVVRALEVLELTGRPLSAQRLPGPEDAPYDFRLYALALPRDMLYARVDARVDEMVRQGLPDEVHALLKGGLSPEAQSMQGLGYKEMVPVLTGKMPLSDAVTLLKIRTRHYAKKQLTWFQRDGRIRWLPWRPGDDMVPLVRTICATCQ